MSEEMTREKTISVIAHMPISSPNDGDDCYCMSEREKVKEMAIVALSAEPCEDAISRQAVHDAVYRASGLAGAMRAIDNLPSVNPQDCNTCEVGNPCMYCKHEFEPQESEGV